MEWRIVLPPSFEKDGFAVLDDVLPAAKADALRAELLGLRDADALQPNKVNFGRSVFIKPHVFDADMHAPEIRALAPTFGAIFRSDALVDALGASSETLKSTLLRGSDAKTVKLQYNEGGGGCFPLHFDNPGRPNERAITFLVYLNPAWREGDGGELQLLPFLGAPRTIAPLHNRAVCFRSDRVLHRTLPSVVERLCFTVWLDGTSTNSDADLLLSTKHLDLDRLDCFCGHALQRTLARTVYADLFAESLTSCMQESEGCAPMLAAHTAHVERLMQNPRVKAFVESLRAMLPPESSEVRM